MVWSNLRLSLAWPDPVPSVRNGTNIRAAQLSTEIYTDRIVDCGDLQARFHESLTCMLPEIVVGLVSLFTRQLFDVLNFVRALTGFGLVPNPRLFFP